MAYPRTDDEMRPFVVMSNGPLNKAKLPGIEGLNDFKTHVSYKPLGLFIYGRRLSWQFE